VGLVLEDLPRDLQVVRRIFEDFGHVSGLHLNLPKTVIIPLGDSQPEEVQASLQSQGDPWAAIACAGWGMYLGFATGPAKANHSWDKATTSMMSRSLLWPWSSLGMQFAAYAYNIFVLSAALFVAQLEDPSPSILALEKTCLARAVPGPHRWCSAADLHYLRCAFGFPHQFRSLSVMSAASQIRVSMWEDAASGGLSVRRRATELDDAIAETPFIVRLARWHTRIRERIFLYFDARSSFYIRFSSQKSR